MEVVTLENGTMIGHVKWECRAHANEWCRLWMEVRSFAYPHVTSNAIVRYKVNFPQNCYTVDN